MSLSRWILLSLFAVSCASAPEPPAIEESVNPGINDSYEEPVVGEWVERFESEGREIFDLREEIVAAIGLSSGQRVADVGCGTGLLTPILARAVGDEGRVYAVDIVPEFLEFVGDRMREMGLEQVETVLCTERSIELEPSSVDVVFVCDTYHHFEYPRSTLASIHRALRKGGELVVIDFERIPGVSSDWILGHVRAGKEVFSAEIRAAGFELVEEVDLLEQNYFLRFRRE